MTNRRNVLATVLMVAVLGSLGCVQERASMGRYADDTAITSKVNGALLADPQVSGLDVQVETHKGTVQLSGFVDSAYQKRHAEDIARSISGVREVKNDIEIKSR